MYHKLILILLLTCSVFGQGGGAKKSVLTQAQKDSINNLIKDSLDTRLSWVVNVKEYGAVGDGSTDDYSAIQGALNTNAGTIIIGGSLADTFIVSKPLEPKSNQKLIVNGYLKNADGITRNLTSDVASGQNKVILTNADDYFEVGMWVAISDDNATLQGGTAGHTRRRADTKEITAISGDTITVNSNWLVSYTVAANGKIGTCQSVLLYENKSNITIEGTGVIDANKSTFNDVEPYEVGEENRAGCAVTFEYCSNIRLKDITLRNSLLHNFHANYSDSIFINSIISEKAHDKNLLIWNSTYGIITNSIFYYADYEDGIILYSNNDKWQISNNKLIENGRYGISIDTNSDDVQLSNNFYYDNGVNLWLAGGNITAVGERLYHGGYFRHSTATRRMSLGINASSDINLIGVRVDSCYKGLDNITVQGNSQRINFIGGGTYGTLNATNTGIGVAFRSSGGFEPSYINFTNFTFKNLKSGFAAGTTPTGIVLNGCYFVNNTSNGSGFYASGVLKDQVVIRNTYGITTESAGVDSVESGETYILITHGLTYTPSAKHISITLLSDLGSATQYYIPTEHINSSTFRIYLDADPEQTVYLAWKVRL